ncbi:MAG: group II intron reverse transcriptase/maturase [Thermodesulfobacteriota bacterium]
MNKAKPFCISKWEVWEAYKRVKVNQGAAGVDGQSIAEFEEDLKNNLFKIWNRMSSGSYFPPPVRRVDIPKGDGRTRPLGIPTVADRIAQTVVKRYLEPILEGCFHSDSYGYRLGKSAIEAVGVARQRCWQYDWVLDLDIKGFFDSIDHSLLMRAVRKHTDCKWVFLYIERWLKAPVQLEDGSLIHREKGTPQGGVISPLLANLFLHYAFDKWMQRNYPHIPFERYADDGICHCRSKAEAEGLRVAIEQRFAGCGLELNLQKTKMVYCKDDNRQEDYPEQKFDFLGYTFRPRRSKSRWGRFFVNFTPAISHKAAKSIRDTIRHWRLHRRTDRSLDELAQIINPVLRGWINYYGSFYASRKYKRLRGHNRRARHWLQRIARSQSGLFAHWQLSQFKAGQ